nr:hypothetical protein [uncultured Cohaesibacter sp.]
MSDRSKKAAQSRARRLPSPKPHEDAIAMLLEATRSGATKTCLSAVFALIYIDKAQLQITAEAELTESMAGVVSRTQEGIDPGWDFETAYILHHTNGDTKVALRSSHADMIAIRYKVDVEDIAPISGERLASIASIPLSIDKPEHISAAITLAEREFGKISRDRSDLH